MSLALVPGDSVWLERKGAAGIPCRLHRVDHDGWWLVARGEPPAVGTAIHLSWGSSSGAWIAPSRVIGIVRAGAVDEGAIQLHTELVVAPPAETSRCERRRFLRVRCSVPFSIVAEGREVSGMCRDLSASGMRGTIHGRVRTQIDVGVEIGLPFGSVGVPGHVLRLSRRRDRCDVALTFFPDERTEDRIVAFVLDRERSILRGR